MTFFCACLLTDSFIKLSTKVDTTLLIFTLRNYFPFMTNGFLWRGAVIFQLNLRAQRRMENRGRDAAIITIQESSLTKRHG